MTKPNHFLLTAPVFILLSCNRIETQYSSTSNFHFPTIIERNINEDAHWINSHKYNIRYIGELSDTILIEQNLIHVIHEQPDTSDSIYKYQKKNFGKYFLDYTERRNFKDMSQVELLIKVDTSQIININNEKAHPVLIQNQSPDTITIGHRNIIPLTTETKTKNGKWKNFEESFPFMCNIGLNSIILPPKEIAITSILIHSENFRIKAGNNYSNAFY